MTARRPSATHQKTGKRFIAYMSWKLHGFPGATEIMGTEIVKNSVSAWDSTFIKGEGSILGFGGLTLYW